MNTQSFIGSIPGIANNESSLYEGNLVPYFKIIFSAPNIHHGYHGLRHMLHVTWACYRACEYYGEDGAGLLSPREMRNLLIAALFHDYGHCGKSGDDSLNIEVAIQGLLENLQPEDKFYGGDIVSILKVTKFPHTDLGKSMTLEQKIIRDADMSQAFGPVWIGDIVAGFGSELGKTPLEMLRQQEGFLKGVSFYTDFARELWGDIAIEAKLQEARDLIKILES